MIIKIPYKHISCILYYIVLYMDSQIDKIRSHLDDLSKQEYAKHDYIPHKTSAKPLANNVKDKEADMEINKLKGKIIQINRKKEYKSGFNNSFNVDKMNNSFMDNTSDVFNIVEDASAYMEWRKTPIENKLQILEEYFESEPHFTSQNISLDDEIKDELRKAVEEKRILYKKDILFDKINKKILNIPLIKYIDEKFVLKEEEKKINIKKQNLSNINKLMKRK